ncbi:MAG: hypothetical protein MHM6MM_000767 [Cercozoa sp. M6MM]
MADEVRSRLPIAFALCEQLRAEVDTLERAFFSSQHGGYTQVDGALHDAELQVRNRLMQVTQELNALDTMLLSVPASKRLLYRSRVHSLREDVEQLRQQSSPLLDKASDLRQAQEVREELFAGRDTSRNTENLALLGKESTHLQYGADAARSALDVGRAALNRLREQRRTLLSAQQKIANVARTLGT